MNAVYNRYELTARLLPRWRRIEEGSLKFKHGSVSFRLASEIVDAAVWRDPPHVVLANLGYVPGSTYRPPDEKEVRLFLTRYGPLGFGIGVGDVSTVRTAGVSEPEGTDYSLESFYSVQRRLRRAWEAGEAQLFTDPLGGDVRYWPLDVKVQRGRLVIETKSCLDYMGLLLARDIAEGHAKRCESETTCSTPYFIAQRSDAIYCSHPCAVLMNVKRWRASERLKRQKSQRRKR
jgi:hypothetical protein